MFSRSLNKVWCVNSLINDVKIELTACGCLQNTIAQQPPLPPYKPRPCCPPFVSDPISKLNFCGGRRQFKCFCRSWREKLVWNLLGDQSVLGGEWPQIGWKDCAGLCGSLTFFFSFCSFKAFYSGCVDDAFTKSLRSFRSFWIMEQLSQHRYNCVMWFSVTHWTRAVLFLELLMQIIS